MITLLVMLTVVSVSVAVVSATIAWRVVHENRRLSEARVAALADAIRAGEAPDSQPVAVTHLLDDEQPSLGRQRLTVAGMAAALLVLVFIVGRVAGGGADPGAAADAAMPAAVDSGGAPASLDLVSLTHELGADGQLELRGEVRNAVSGANMGRVSVVAALFDRQGAYLSSSRAPLEERATADARAATFLVTVPDGSRVGRYRVSFRAGDHVVPHVDRRQVSPTSDRSAVP